MRLYLYFSIIFGSGGAASPCGYLCLWLFVCFVFGPGGALFHATVFVFSFVFGPGVACSRRKVDL